MCCSVSTAPSMMSLRQRHIDPQLAMGSQRFVESSHAAGGHQGEGSSYPPSWPRPNLRQSHGQVDTLGLAVSHPSVFYPSSPSYSSSSSSSAPHSSFYPSSFQPMDPIPDSPPRRSRSYGYSRMHVCVRVRAHPAWHESSAVHKTSISELILFSCLPDIQASMHVC